MYLNRVDSIQQAKENGEYKAALVELLYQLADDDLIVSYRGSEWLGLAPHIEEDVAFSSIAQDTMGHAAAFYQMLEFLGEGKADDLAQLRSAEQFHHAVVLERPNGTGYYMNQPKYDWAFAVVRHYFYEIFKQVRLDSLTKSSFYPLVQLARKIMPEQRYHLLHWQVWFTQLTNSTEEARQRMLHAIEKVWSEIGGLVDLGPNGEAMVRYGLIEGEEMLAQRFREKAKKVFESNHLPWIGEMKKGEYNGRAGEHTEDLVSALQILSEVYRLDPAANW